MIIFFHFGAIYYFLGDGATTKKENANAFPLNKFYHLMKYFFINR